MSLVTGSLRAESDLKNVVVFVTPPESIEGLRTVLAGLPTYFSATVVILLHPGTGRERPITSNLNTNPRLMVIPGTDGLQLRKNRAYVVYTTQHLAIGKDNRLTSYFVDVANSPIAMGGEVSSAVVKPDALLGTLCERFGSGAIAVALGELTVREAEGFRKIRSAGGHTIALLNPDQDWTGSSSPRTSPNAIGERLAATEIGKRIGEILVPAVRP